MTSLELDLDNIIYVEIHKNDELYVKYPDDSKEGLKAKLVNPYRIVKFNWRHLEKLEKSKYHIGLINPSEGITYKDGNKNRLECFRAFEIAFSFIEDKEKLLMPYLLDKHVTTGNGTYESSQNTGDFNVIKFNLNIELHKRGMQKMFSKFNGQHNFMMTALSTYFEIHKKLLGLKEIPNNSLMKFAIDKYNKEMTNAKEVLNISYMYSDGTLKTRILMENENNNIGDKRVNDLLYNRKFEAKFKYTKRLPELKTKVRSEMCINVARKSNYRILAYNINDKSILGGYKISWYIVDDTPIEDVKQLISSVYEETIGRI